MNPYLPDDRQDVDLDILAEDAYYLAGEMFETENPTSEQVEAAIRELEDVGEKYL